MMKNKEKVLIISNEIVDKVMAGPGIRYYEIAKALSSEMDVTVAIPGSTTINSQSIRFVEYSSKHAEVLRQMVKDFGVVFVTPFAIDQFSWLSEIPGKLVVDLYDPFVLENLFYFQDASLDVRLAYHARAVDVVNKALKIGDFFVCGSERQRDYWIGALTANGRVNPLTFSQSADMRVLIDVVGIGLPSRNLEGKPFLKGIHPKFPEDAKIVLWGGGVWDWLDPLTLIKAWEKVIEQNPLARLVFLGTKHPNADVPTHRVVNELQALANSKGMNKNTVFFFEWLSTEERESLLEEADVGVVLHTNHIETRFSIRTRVMDYIWAKIPIIVSDGDVTSEWVGEYRLGRVVKQEDIGSVTSALNDLLAKPKEEWARAFEKVIPMFTWQRAVEPLMRYCLFGEKALDRGEQLSNYLGNKKYYLAQMKYVYKNKGLKGLLRKIQDKARRFLDGL